MTDYPSPTCSRCGRQDDGIVLSDDGLCAICTSDRDEAPETRSPRSPWCLCDQIDPADRPCLDCQAERAEAQGRRVLDALGVFCDGEAPDLADALLAGADALLAGWGACPHGIDRGAATCGDCEEDDAGITDHDRHRDDDPQREEP